MNANFFLTVNVFLTRVMTGKRKGKGRVEGGENMVREKVAKERRVINVPYDCHSCFLPLLSDTLPIFDELCKRSFRFILSCVFRGSPLVRAVAHHALKIARYNIYSVIRSNALFCCARYGSTAADLLAGKIDVSNHVFKNM